MPECNVRLGLTDSDILTSKHSLSLLTHRPAPGERGLRLSSGRGNYKTARGCDRLTQGDGVTLSAGFVGSRLVSGEREGREETFVRSRPSRDSRAGTTQVTQQPGDLKTLRDTANQSTLARGPQVILIPGVPGTPLTQAIFLCSDFLSGLHCPAKQAPPQSN